MKGVLRFIMMLLAEGGLAFLIPFIWNQSVGSKYGLQRYILDRQMDRGDLNAILPAVQSAIGWAFLGAFAVALVSWLAWYAIGAFGRISNPGQVTRQGRWWKWIAFLGLAASAALGAYLTVPLGAIGKWGYVWVAGYCLLGGFALPYYAGTLIFSSPVLASEVLGRQWLRA